MEKRFHSAVKKVAARMNRRKEKIDLDYLESLFRSIEREELDKCRGRHGYYSKHEGEIFRTSEKIEQYYFGQKNMYGVYAGYDFHNPNTSFKELLK